MNNFVIIPTTKSGNIKFLSILTFESLLAVFMLEVLEGYVEKIVRRQLAPTESSPQGVVMAQLVVVDFLHRCLSHEGLP